MPNSSVIFGASVAQRSAFWISASSPVLRKHLHNQIHVHCTPEINKCCRDKSSSLLESVPSSGIIHLLEYEELRVLYIIIENMIPLTYSKSINLQKLGNTQYRHQVVIACILHFPL